MESDTLHIDPEFMAGVLLEIAQERSLEQLLQKLARRALETPEAPLVMVCLIDSGKKHVVSASKGTAEQAVGKVVHALLKTVLTAPLGNIKAEVIRTDRWYALARGTP